jgi:glycerol-3-phosphate O-acyltransferase/dihydroxyacetone phosphate acyltransferase
MYSSVYQKLKEGGCIGIFPEGGSHDRTDLLPLKAGVSIMALGAISSNPDLKLRIVPVGLSYFHPHKFRSRAVVEFGSPIEIPKEFVEEFEKGGDDKKSAVGKVMDLVVDGLKSVTVRAPDYETLMVLFLAFSTSCHEAPELTTLILVLVIPTAYSSDTKAISTPWTTPHPRPNCRVSL